MLFSSGAGIAEGREQDPGKALAKIPWERLSPACESTGERGTGKAAGSRQWTRLRQGVTNGNLTDPFPSTPSSSGRTLRGTERSAPAPKSLTTPGGCPLGTPQHPCPEHRAKIPARSTGFCLPTLPHHQHRATSPKTSRASPTLSQIFISNPLLQLPGKAELCNSQGWVMPKVTHRGWQTPLG